MNQLISADVFVNFARSSRRRQPAVVTALTAGCRLRLGSWHRAGLGLVEVICATLIVGIMLVAALETVGAVFRTQRLNADRLAGPNLALELMTEVLSQPYEDPEPETANTDIGRDEDEAPAPREEFDDVDDYDGWIEPSIVGHDGTPNAGFAAWRRRVEVEWVDSSTGVAANTDTDLKRITVTVFSPTGEQTQLSAYRAKNGVLEQVEAEMTIVTWLGAELQLGSENTPVSVGTNLTNHATDAD